MPTVNKSASHTFTLSGLPFPGGNGPVLANGLEAWLSATAECQREFVAFMSKRLEKDRDLIRDLQSSRDPARTADIQARWLGECVRDYSSQVSRVMAIYMRSIDGELGREGSKEPSNSER
ncbi:phasin family protein [Microvirga thermotolerans]|uniref:Phasin family protein n=1 Tax=Microvirga thermotolerans TaxID=2651334 RepID=A0A5P9JR16_9HYPH|nr:phasin family protein [Microvirga thermotolerans]QFU14783.1 phasin family protein [Microvirga thermotolerans]